MNQPIYVAIIRALYGAIVLALLQAVPVYATTGNLKTAGVTAVPVFLGYLLVRGVAEGWVDQTSIPVLPFSSTTPGPTAPPKA